MENNIERFGVVLIVLVICFTIGLTYRSNLKKDSSDIVIMDETTMHSDQDKKHLYIHTKNLEISDSIVTKFPKSSYILSWDSGKLQDAYFVFPGADSNKINSFIKYMNQ